MKTHLTIFGALLIMLIASPAPAESLKIATGEWSPYASVHLPKQGVFTEIISETLKVMGVDGEYQFYPWKRAYHNVKTGAIWAAYPFADTKNRRDEVLYSDPVLRSTARLFYYKKAGRGDVIRNASFEDLKQYRVVGVSGYYYESLLKARRIDGEYVTTPEMALEQLHADRADLFISNELVGWHLIRTLYPEETEQFATLSKPFHRNRLYLIASKRYPDSEALLARFNAALNAVKNDYFYKEMLKKLRNFHRHGRQESSR